MRKKHKRDIITWFFLRLLRVFAAKSTDLFFNHEKAGA